MKILIAADSFKDALTARDVCKAIAYGLVQALPLSEVDPFPLADGGEGTVDILQQHLQAEEIQLEVKDPLGRPVQASYLLSADKKTAYIEMAQASGLPLLKDEERNPLYTSTFGTGQLIRHAVIQQGARHILLGIGGSATNDMGIGLAAALGYRFLDGDGQRLEPLGKNLWAIQKVDRESFVLDLKQVKCTVLCDVDNPLYGPKGAAHIYGPQKGASPEDIALLDLGLKHLAQLLEQDRGIELAETPGAGAAGGLGAGAMAFLGAKLQPGIETILQITGFEERVKQCDYIITGEGKIDEQSLHGKLIRGITRLAQRHQKPVIALCGKLDLAPAGIRELGLQAAFSICDGPMKLSEALGRTDELLERTAFGVGRLLERS
jgi:glycerate kinase